MKESMDDYSRELKRLSDVELCREAKEHISLMKLELAEDVRLYRRLCKLERVINEFALRTGLTWFDMR